MPIKVTNNEARPRVFPLRGEGVRGTLTLLPGDNLVEDEQWAQAKQTKWTVKGKQVAAVDVLIEEGHLTVDKKGGAAAAKEAANADSIATSGNIPASRIGGLPGEGGEDITRRASAEEQDAKERAKNEKRK